MSTADLISLLSQGGAVVAIFALLYWGKGSVDKLMADHWERLDKVITDHRTEMAALATYHRAETREIIEQFRGDIRKISDDTTEAIAALTAEVKSLGNEVRHT